MMKETNATPSRFTVGTGETGSFCGYDTEAEARAEAKDWAKSEPGVTVYVWERDANGQILDVVATYTEEAEGYGSEAHAGDYHGREYLLMDDEERSVRYGN